RLVARARDRRHGRTHARRACGMTGDESASRHPSGGATNVHPLETLALRLLAGLAAAGVLLGLTGQLSARLFGGTWPPVEPSDVASIVLSYPHHLGDPAQAWPARARGLVPGPVAFYATLAALLLPALAAAAWL